MPEQLISPIIPSSTRHRHWTATGQPARPLPLADQPTIGVAPTDVVYGMSRLDPSGRITDYSIIAALGWHPGDQFAVAARARLIELSCDPAGLFTVTGRGHVPLPAMARRRLDLQPGDRVLLAATAATGELVIYPMATVHDAVRAVQAGGEIA